MKKFIILTLIAALLLAACEDTPSTPPTDGGSTDSATDGGTTGECTNDYIIAEDTPIEGEAVIGEQVEKQWIFENTGTCTWGEGYIFTQIGGGFVSATEVEQPLPVTAPGEQAQVRVLLDISDETAVGTQQEAVFQLRDAEGNGFGAEDQVPFVLLTPVEGELDIATPTPRE